MAKQSSGSLNFRDDNVFADLGAGDDEPAKRGLSIVTAHVESGAGYDNFFANIFIQRSNNFTIPFWRSGYERII